MRFFTGCCTVFAVIASAKFMDIAESLLQGAQKAGVPVSSIPGIGGAQTTTPQPTLAPEGLSNQLEAAEKMVTRMEELEKAAKYESEHEDELKRLGQRNDDMGLTKVRV